MRLFKALSTLTLALPTLCGLGFVQSAQAGNHYDDGAVSLLETSLAADEQFYHRTFLIDVPESKNYFIEFWGLPAKYADGQFTEYSIFLDDEIIGTASPEFGNWQSIKVNAGSSLRIDKGEHILSVATLAPEIPMVETVKISANKYDVISSEEYEDYLAASLESEAIDFMPETYSTQSLGAPDGNFATEDVPVLYTFYQNFYWTKGEEITLTSSSAIEHLMDVVFYGHPKKPSIIHAPSIGDPHPGIIDSIPLPDPNPSLDKSLSKFYTPATTEEMQGLNWKFVSEKSLHSTGQEISGYVRVPMTGHYMVRIISAKVLTPSVADFDMNDQYIYEDAPINYYGINPLVELNF